jgi:HK97 family phage major capsid protein
MPLDGAHDPTSDQDDLKKLAFGLKKATDDVRIFAEKAQGEIKTFGDLTRETKEHADKALMEMNDISARLSDLEQKVVRRGGVQHEPETLKSIGQHVVDNDDVKTRLLAGPQKGTVNFKVDTKTILSATGTWGSTASVTNSLVVPDRQIGTLPLPMRPLTIRDLVSPGQTTSNAIEWAIQTTRTNNAAVVAENALKPSSNYVWDLRSYPVRTLAHLVKASRQILDDAPGLQSTIDAEMRYGLAYAEEVEMLNGDGTGAHLLGIIPQAASYSAAFSLTGETAIDRIRLAMLQGVLALFPVSGIVLHPTDWTKVETLKDATGRYLIGDPQGQITPRLWGLPVVSSLAMTAGTFLVGAFKMGAQVFDRLNVEVLISTENNDDFEKNMVTIRCEERLAFIVKRPTAFVTGNLP